MSDAPIDLLAYLLLLQALPVIGLTAMGSRDTAVCRIILGAQILLIALFFLVWGGYGTDSWAYLPRFDREMVDVEKEWLFWSIGILFSELFYDPWPLKLVSALGALTLCFAIVSYFNHRGLHYSIAAVWALVLVPALFLLIGSGVRQGLAGALIVLGFVYPRQRYHQVFAAASIAAVFVHESSIVFAAALTASRLSTTMVRYALALAPLLSLAGYWLGTSVLELEMEHYVPHTDKDEGQFHWAKFVLAYAIVAVALFLVRDADRSDRQLVAGYGYMVAASSLFVVYEVPFERLLGYAELLLPFVAAVTIGALGWERRRLALIWVAGTGAGVLLWSHPSIITTLGYAVS